MTRAGWCRECGEWVWVDEDDACQNGHGPDCVDAIHDSEPLPGDGESQRDASAPAVDAAPASLLEDAAFGVGDFPAELDRFNWGAFFLTPIWGIVYGSSAVLGWWAFSLAAALGIAMLVGDVSTASAIAGVSSVTTVVEIAVRLWIGMNANRWLWKRETLRIALVPGGRPRFSVVRFQTRQRTWLAWGIGITVLSMISLAVLGLSTDPAAADVRQQFMITPAQVAAAAVWNVAEIVLALWLAGKLKQERTPTQAL